MAEEDILVEIDGELIIVTLNRPRKFNALTGRMLATWLAAVRSLGTNPALRVMLVRANGDYFSSGADLQDLKASAGWTTPREFREIYRAGSYTLQPLGDELETVEKPIVVAHRGPCLGGGLELSLSCDFRLASEKASYGLPELKLGLLPGSGGTSRLTRLIGTHWTRWLIMAGKTIDAQEARRIGLIHDVFPDDSFEEQVLGFCRDLAKMPMEAMAAAKMTIELSADLDRAQARQVERLANSSLILDEEHLALMASLMKKFGGR